ncbi:GIY-YIG nuclease family protein [Vibrio alginolyticus]|uniref:GIY-YIG nuclease family protein n=1 Tax=Vibrio alginolyticus TaxID=663 RepID=UPI00375408CD
MDGYIYIAWDVTKPNQCKIGKTTRSPSKRVSETTNPDYELYNLYNVGYTRLDFIEKDIHAKLKDSGIQQIAHRSTGMLSEWFTCTKEEADEFVAEYLGNVQSKREKRLKEEAKRQKQLEAQSINQAKAREAIVAFSHSYEAHIDQISSNFQRLDAARKSELHQAELLNTSSSFSLLIIVMSIGMGLMYALPLFLILGSILQIEGGGWASWGLGSIFALIQSGGPCVKETDEQKVHEHMVHWDNDNCYTETILAIKQIENYKHYLNNLHYQKDSPIPFEQYRKVD